MSTVDVAASDSTPPREDVLTSNLPDTIQDPRTSNGHPVTGTRLDGFQALARVRSSISISFDGWLADNQLDMLGITAHYLDEHLQVRNVLLGLKPMYGAHSGVARRRRYFESKQREVSHSRIYQLVANGGVRWNSDLDMIERALQLRDALQLYQDHYASADTGTLDKGDCLGAADWQELSELRALLRPLRDASVKSQAVPVNGHNGALWQTLSTTEWLLAKFEELKRQPLSRYFHTCINLGWKKLNRYYELSDSSPAYRFAVFLQSSHKLAWFERNWGDRKDWMKAVEQTINIAWSDCRRRWPNEVQSPRLPGGSRPHEELDEFERFMEPEAEPEMDDHCAGATSPVSEPKSRCSGGATTITVFLCCDTWHSRFSPVPALQTSVPSPSQATY